MHTNHFPTLAFVYILQVQLLYNRANGPFGNIPIPEHEVLVLRYGYNGWCGSKETTMKRYTPPAPKTKLKSKAAPAAGMEAEEEAMAEEVEVSVGGKGKWLWGKWCVGLGHEALQHSCTQGTF